MKEIDKKLIEVLDKYENCSYCRSCDECLASEPFDGTNTSWCEFLRERDKRIIDKMERVFCS